MAIFTNRATLIYGGLVQNSNTVTGEIVEVLGLTKDALNTTYTAGEDITYTVSVTNTGTAPYTGLTLVDDLGAYPFGTETLYPLAYDEGTIRYYVNGTLQPTPTVTATQPLTVTGINAPAGGNALILYSATVRGTAPLSVGGQITNTATLLGGCEPIVATETVTARETADLRITKGLCPASVACNGTVTYTLTIENYGNIPVIATDNAVVTDTFDPILTGLTAAFNGVPLTEGTQYVYNQATGVFTTLGGTVTVPAATYTQDPVTGEITVTPGISVLEISGTV